MCWELLWTTGISCRPKCSRLGEVHAVLLEQDLGSFRPPVRSSARPAKCQLPLEGGASLLVSRFSRPPTTMAVWNCLCGLLDNAGTQQMRDRASISLPNGGLGIRSATRDRDSAFWASWADALPTIRERHPSVADHFCVAFQRRDGGFHMSEAASCRERLMERGFRLSRMGRRRQRIATGSGFARRPYARGGPTGVAERRSTAH